MKLKRILASALSAAILCTLLVSAPPALAASTAGFTDIADPAVAGAAETLRLLGVVNGTGGSAFRPDGTLTRAEFCKMALEIMGKGGEAAAQMNRTIFLDVKGDYWARGYINLAASTRLGASSDGTGGDMLMMGVGDGTFRPNQVITYAEAITILMRILSYTAKDVAAGSSWYGGYLAAAKAAGLTEGVSLAWNSTISRGQTALLFQNLLFIPPKGATTPYLTSLGGSVTTEAVVLSLNATAADGTTGCIAVTGADAPYKTDHAAFAANLAGSRAKLVLDKAGKVIALQKAPGGSSKTVSVVSAQATYLTAKGGTKLDVAADAVVYRENDQTSYDKVYLNLKAGSQVVFHYSAAGKLEYLYLPATAAADTAAVAKATGSANPFSSLVGSDTGYRILKNGIAATLSDIRQYDVATYDKGTKTLSVSDLRLTGVYENVAPSPATPLRVTVLGATFPVLSSAYADLASFKIGDVITLLLTADGQVAGAVSPSAARSTTVGVVKLTGSSATVTPLADLRDSSGARITLSGETGLSDTSAAALQGQLVTVSSSRVGSISLSRLTESGAAGSLDVYKRTLGGLALADNVTLYERVGNSVPAAISLDQITRPSVPASKISYVGKDYAGRVNILVFDDVTGDQYTYGIAKAGDRQEGGSGSLGYSNPTITVIYGNGKTSDRLISGADIADGKFVGIAASLEEIGGVKKLAGWVELKAFSGVSRTAFELSGAAAGTSASIGKVSTNEMELPISGNVVCYNKTTKTWFASLDEARAYSDTLTIYYDRAPQEGGKVRLVVAG